MSTRVLDLDDDEYVSSEDDDFVLEEEGGGSEEDAGAPPVAKAKLRKCAPIEADEVRALRAAAREVCGDDALHDARDDGAGADGRALRADEVDDLWSQLNAPPPNTSASSTRVSKDAATSAQTEVQCTAPVVGSKRDVMSMISDLNKRPAKRARPLDAKQAALKAVLAYGGARDVVPLESRQGAAQGARVDMEALRAVASSAQVSAANKKVAITETVKFAGQTMQVTKLLTAGTQAAKTAQQQAESARVRAALAASAAKAEADVNSGIHALSGSVASGTAALVAAARRAAATVVDQPSSFVSALHSDDPRTIAAAAGAGLSAPPPSGAGTLSLTSVVANLDKPESISTLAKSSIDWEQYKHREGVADELELATKDGYVERQAFLARVDERAEERSKAARASERLKRDLAAPPSSRH